MGTVSDDGYGGACNEVSEYETLTLCQVIRMNIRWRGQFLGDQLGTD